MNEKTTRQPLAKPEKKRLPDEASAKRCLLNLLRTNRRLLRMNNDNNFITF